MKRKRKEENPGCRGIVIGLILIFLVTLYSLGGCKKFEVGDCVEGMWSESWKGQRLGIEAIGKFSYKTYILWSPSISDRPLDIGFLESWFWKKVPCR